MIPVVRRHVIAKVPDIRTAPEWWSEEDEAKRQTLYKRAHDLDSKLKPSEYAQRSYVIERTPGYLRLVHVTFEELRP